VQIDGDVVAVAVDDDDDGVTFIIAKIALATKCAVKRLLHVK